MGSIQSQKQQTEEETHGPLAPPPQTVTPLPLDTPIYEDKVRFVCMSDTHSKASEFQGRIPPGDVFLHAGDFTYLGLPNEVEDFNRFLGTLSHPYKIVIAGNHDLSFDDKFLNSTVKTRVRFDPTEIRQYLEDRDLTRMKDLLTNCVYLEDSEVSVFGLRIWGSPWQPEFSDWAFNLPRGGEQIRKQWDLFQMASTFWLHTDLQLVMVTWPVILHATGVVLIYFTQSRIALNPNITCFGHLHEGFGATTDGVTTFVNASSLDVHYKPVNTPIIFDIPAAVCKHSSDGDTRQQEVLKTQI